MTHNFIYLASQSPRRRQLLEQLGVRYELLLPGPEEDAEAIEAVLPCEDPAAYVQRVTALKLDAAVARHAGRRLAPAPILCSDTTVALGPRIYGKPEDAQDAARMLAELAGRAHQVLTAVALQAADGRRLAALSVSCVRFGAMTPAQIAAYAASGEPLGKAGAYAVQGLGAALVESVHGSYSNVVGLPLAQVVELLLRRGIVEPDWEVPS